MIELLGDESMTFLDFISKILVWDPELRITPIEALQHPWIVEGLPKKVLIHHKRMLGLDVPSDEESEPEDQQHCEIDAEVSQSRLVADPDQQDSISRPVNQLEDIDLDEIELEENNYGCAEDNFVFSKTQPLKLKGLTKKLVAE